jgi:hypothetical protein
LAEAFRGLFLLAVQTPMMNWNRSITALVFSFFACSRTHQPVVARSYIDSLLSHYSQPAILRSNEVEIEFWRNRIKSGDPGGTLTEKYAQARLMRFHLLGDVRDLREADSLYQGLYQSAPRPDNALILGLTRILLLKEQFDSAEELIRELQQRDSLSVEDQESLWSCQFDRLFACGQYDSASRILNRMRAKLDYPYFFRLSRMEDMEGSSDSSIYHLLIAGERAKTNDFLKQFALSRAADLYAQEGVWVKARGLYSVCLSLNPSDFHSLLGLGRIVLLKDGDDRLADQIFQFVRQQFHGPDPLFQLQELALSLQDSVLARRYAEEFAREASDSSQGNRYGRQLVDLYTGILDNPSKAERIAAAETRNRANPAAFAWYAWSLFRNRKTQLAISVYQKQVSGRHLEALESFWMAKFLRVSGREKEANALFNSAQKNRFSLGPERLKDLENELN